MKYILITLTLSFASCGTNEPSIEGKLTNLTVNDNKASFSLNEVQYRNVALLPSTAQTLQNLGGQEIKVWFENNHTEISQVRTVADTIAFWKWATIIFGGTLLLSMILRLLPDGVVNPKYQKEIYGGRYGGESWW